MRPAGDFTAALRAEWCKLRTVRGWTVVLLLAGAMIVLFTFLQANGKHEGSCTGQAQSTCVAGHPYVATGPAGEAVADSYEFVHRRLIGPGTITARLVARSGRVWTGPANEAPTLADTAPGLAAWSKVGLLITSGLAQGSPYAAVMATGAHGVRFQYDFTGDEAAGSTRTAGWLRLTRSGDTITGYASADGVRWRRVGRTTLSGLPATVYLGLFATSPTTLGGSATQATAVFDQVSAGASAPWSPTSVGYGPNDFYTTLGPGRDRVTGSTVSVTGSGDIAPAVANAGGDTASDSLLFGLVVALLILVVIGTTFITSEYRRGLIRTSFTAVPDRGVVLAAKAVVVGVAGFLVGALASAAAIPLAEHVMAANGDYIFPTGPWGVARVIAGSGVLTGLTAVAMLGLGSILRRSASAILIGVALFVLPAFAGPGILGPNTAGSLAVWLYRITPAAGFSVLDLLPRSALVTYPYTMTNGYYPLPVWGGLLVLTAYAALALAAGLVLLRRRDA